MKDEDIFKNFNTNELNELWENGLPSQKSKRIKQIYSPDSHQDYYYYTEFKHRKDGGSGDTRYYRNFDGMSKSTTAYTFNQKEDDAITPGRCIGNDCSQIVNKQHMYNLIKVI